MLSESTNLRQRFILGAALTVPFFASLLYFVLAPEAWMSRVAYGGVKVFILILPLLATFLWIGREKVREGKPQHGKSALLGTAFGLAIAAAMVGLMKTPIGDFVREGAPIVIERMTALGIADHFLAAALIISTLHAALEEYYWRWFAYGQLQRVSKGITPHLIAGFGFAAHHYVIVWVYFTPWLAIFLGTCVAIGGMFWSILYQRTGSLAGSWLSHVFIDLAIFWIGWELING